MALSALVIGLALVWAAFELGQSRAGHNRMQAIERQTELQRELLKVSRDNEALREQIALLETSDKINAEAYRRVESQLADLQDQVQAQSEDIAFYRGIVGADQQAGLRVQNFELLPGAEPGEFNVRLVLAQALRNKQAISGRVLLAVAGEQAGESVTLGMGQLRGGAAETLDFSFRYFQNLETELRVPEGFAPATVTVRLVPRGANRKDVEESFDWRVSNG